MAIHSSTGTQTAKDAPSPTATVQPDFSNTTTVENAPARNSFMGLLNQFNAGAGVTPEIEKYLKDITEVVKRSIPGVQLVQLPEPLATHAFIAADKNGQRHAYIILFADAIGVRPTGNQPISRYIQQAFGSLVTQYPGTKMVNAPIIFNYDMSRSRQMANAIIGALLPQVNEQIGQTAIPVLSAAGEFAIDLNLDMARQFENTHSPHEVRPAADIGFTLALRRPSRNQQQGFGQQQHDNDQQVPFMAVTAKVDIIGPQRDIQSNSVRYVPVIRITSITSQLPLIGAAFLGLVVAADYFITKRVWMNAFRRFDKGAPNLGNLLPNPDPKKANELWFITNQMEMDAVVMQQFSQPYLMLDVQEGRDRLPGLYAFADDGTGRQTLLHSAGSFFGMEPPSNMLISAQAATTYEGYYGDPSGRLIDSRNITYLDQVAKTGVLDSNITQALMNYDINPLRRADIVASITQNFVSVHETKLAVLDSQFMSWVASAVKNANMRIHDPNGISGLVQLTSAFSSFTNYTGFSGVTSQQGAFNTSRSGFYG